MIHLAIFASGGGSNAEKIAQYFDGHQDICISLYITNNPESGVIPLGKLYHTDVLYLPKHQLRDADYLKTILKERDIDGIILAGYLLKIPSGLVHAFPDKIINIHPALLPKYGGKGMYGLHVHQAVYAHQEKISGMTIHLVNEVYDEGRILFQAICPLDSTWEPRDIAKEVLALEHKHFSKVIERYFTGKSM